MNGPNYSILGLLVLLCLPCLSLGQDWSSFQNGGELENDGKLPDDWSPETNIAWEVSLPGYGQSSPVVFDRTIYVTSVVGGNKEKVRIQAVHLSDGSEKWSYEQTNSTPEKNTVMVSRAAPTPVADKDGVIAFFEGGDLIALDSAGKKRWSRSLKKEFGELNARHGIAASLEQTDSTVFVWAERMESPFVMAVRKSDGSTVWKKGGVGGTSWSSPRLVRANGGSHLVLSGIGNIVGLDPSNGQRLWEFRNIAGNSSSTPVPVGDGEFLIGSSGSRSGQTGPASCGVIKISKTPDGFEADWKWSSEKASCSFGSPVAYQDMAYFVNRSGVVYCHDLENGLQKFAGRLPCSQIWATPLAANNLIYFFGKDGSTSIIESGDQLNVVRTNQLWKVDVPAKSDRSSSDPASRLGGTVLYGAAVADSHLILRRGDKLYAIRK